MNEKKWNIWIDVFPLDSMPKNKVHFLFRKYMILYRRCMVMLSAYEDVVSDEKKKRPFYEKILMWVGKNLHLSRWLDTKKQILKFEKTLKKYPFEKGPYMVNAMGLFKFKTLFERSVYGKPSYLEFEGHMLRVPEQYDYFLKRIYNDYMQLPPENKRDHHKIEFIEE
jgi:lipopolysaccharide cholinephosphotransferase